MTENVFFEAGTSGGDGVCFKETKTEYFDGTVPDIQYDTTIIANSVCCGMPNDISDACEKGYVYEAPSCFKTVDGMKDGAALSKTDECCIEGWRLDNESLKASCNISNFVYQFVVADELCLLDTTTILPTTNT